MRLRRIRELPPAHAEIPRETSVGWPSSFTLALLGIVLFVGVLTDRSRSVWPSIVAHGSWNGVVTTYFSVTGTSTDGMFSGNRYLLGEFGVMAAVGMFGLGVGFAWWHLRHLAQPQQSRAAPGGMGTAGGPMPA